MAKPNAVRLRVSHELLMQLDEAYKALGRSKANPKPPRHLIGALYMQVLEAMSKERIELALKVPQTPDSEGFQRTERPVGFGG